MTTPWFFINRGERIFNPIFRHKGKYAEMLASNHYKYP